MTRLLFKIRPLTAFGSRLTGAMLFGQIAWRLREDFGEGKLRACLEGYCEGRPFAVVSDAMPEGFVPLPAMPLAWWTNADAASRRKYVKSKKWLPTEALESPLTEWENAARSDAELPESCRKASSLRFRNSISRATGTTGTGSAFAPYNVSALNYSDGAVLDVYSDLDESRLSRNDFRHCLEAIGLFGYGRDASTGLGKYEVLQMEALPAVRSCTHWVTLAAMRPDPNAGYDSQKCFYRPVTYFGRHGAERAIGPNPFKKPIVLAETGAFLTTLKPEPLQYAGRGITGHSTAFPDTVHQGYAPLLPISGAAD